MTDKSQKNRKKIAFLSADIEKLDQIITRYKGDYDASTLFMLEQYEFRREKLYRLLCIELLSLPLESSVHFLPLVQNIATLYTQSKDLLPNIKQDIQRWAIS